MARPLRIQFPGAIYHIAARANERRDIYRSDADRLRFLEILAENVEAHHIRVYAYVLMSNHYHLLIETPRANLSMFMQQLNGAYTVYFNARYRRSGHLFGGRYKAKLVEGDEYLLRLTRYVHLNPVKIQALAKADLAEKRRVLRKYRWSSYPAYAGLKKREKWMDYGPLGEMVSRGQGQKEREYRRYVESGLAETDDELREALVCSSKAIGLESFCRWVEQLHQAEAESQGQPLDVAMRKTEAPVTPDEVFSAAREALGATADDLRKRRSASDARLLTMKALKEEAGLTQREVACALGLRDGSGISRRLSELALRLSKERRLAKSYEQLVKKLHKH